MINKTECSLQIKATAIVVPLILIPGEARLAPAPTIELRG